MNSTRLIKIWYLKLTSSTILWRLDTSLIIRYTVMICIVRDGLYNKTILLPAYCMCNDSNYD